MSKDREPDSDRSKNSDFQITHPQQGETTDQIILFCPMMLVTPEIFSLADGFQKRFVSLSK